MSLFDAYDTEFSALSAEISTNISELQNSYEDEESNSSSTKMIDALLLQANDLIKQMEVEARSSDLKTKKVLQEKLVGYKKSLSELKSSYNRAKESMQRTFLMGNTSSEQRQRLLSTSDKAVRQNDAILAAHRTVLETEEVGLEITRELSRNREKIESSRAKAQEFVGITESARRLLTTMSKRDARQKWTITAVAAVLIVGLTIANNILQGWCHHC